MLHQQRQKNVGAIRYPTWTQCFSSEIDHPALEHCHTPVGNDQHCQPTRTPASQQTVPHGLGSHSGAPIKITPPFPADRNAA